MTLLLSVIAIIQIYALLAIKSSFLGPFKVLTGYSLLFETTRYFYISAGLTTFGVTAEQIEGTVLVMISGTMLLALSALALEYYLTRGVRATGFDKLSWNHQRTANLAFHSSVFAMCLVLTVRFVRYGWLIQAAHDIDVWAGLYSLKIPMLMAISCFLINLHYKNPLKAFIGLCQLVAIVTIDGERSVIFFIGVTIAAYLIAVNRFRWWYLPLLIAIIPFLFYVLTLRRFTDDSAIEIFGKVLQIFDKDLAISLLQQSYGRYYALEGTYLMLDNPNHLNQQFWNASYIIQNLLPSAVLNGEEISLSRIVCQSIEYGRWADNVSCWAYFLQCFTLTAV